MKEKIVAIGDSITWGFPYGEHSSWLNSLRKEFPLWDWINKGINGDTFEGIYYRLEGDVLSQKPIYCILTAGINDIFMGDTIDHLGKIIHQTVQKFKENQIFPILGIPINILVPEMELNLEALQDWIIRYAKENQIPIIDFRGLDFSDFGDEVHPNKKGYIKMGEKAIKALKQIIK